MIRILDAEFQKRARVLGQDVTLDRAAVCVLSLDYRPGKEYAPSLRADVAYGIEDAQGRFQAFNYEDTLATAPLFIAPLEFDEFAKLEASDPNPADITGWGWAEALRHWVEEVLVKRGDFGPGAQAAFKDLQPLRTELEARIEAAKPRPAAPVPEPERGRSPANLPNVKGGGA